MMKCRLLIFWLVLSLPALYSCQSVVDENTRMEGTFRWLASEDDGSQTLLLTDTVRLELSGDHFRITGKNKLIYGYGTWSRLDDTLVFADAMARNGTQSWEWILNGPYLVERKGKNVELLKEDTGLVWAYQLSDLSH